MKVTRSFVSAISMLAVLTVMTSGCAVNFYKQSPKSKKKIVELETKVSELEQLRLQELKQFEGVKSQLENKFRDLIARDQVSVSVSDAGLAIVLADEILFDSGKAEVKDKAVTLLNKVSDIIIREIPDKDIGIAGHTDNVPITHSSWKSNWELSTTRATNVLHSLDDRGIPPVQLSATGYGEYRPVASNDTAEGRMKNRRVEIVILPEYSLSKAGADGSPYMK